MPLTLGYPLFADLGILVSVQGQTKNFQAILTFFFNQILSLGVSYFPSHVLIH